MNKTAFIREALLSGNEIHVKDLATQLDSRRGTVDSTRRRLEREGYVFRCVRPNVYQLIRRQATPVPSPTRQSSLAAPPHPTLGSTLAVRAVSLDEDNVLHMMVRDSAGNRYLVMVDGYREAVDITRPSDEETAPAG